jgi:hypothetical protein
MNDREFALIFKSAPWRQSRWLKDIIRSLSNRPEPVQSDTRTAV